MSTDRQLIIGFKAFGVPGPQGSKSFKGMRTSKATGKTFAVLAESSAKVKPWRDAVLAAGLTYLAAHPGAKIAGPVELEVVFYLPRPIGASKTLDIVPAVQPDLSKIIRSTEDAITDAGLWEDDARVIRTDARKFYAVGPELHRIYVKGYHWENPGANIIIRPAERTR